MPVLRFISEFKWIETGAFFVDENRFAEKSRRQFV